MVVGLASTGWKYIPAGASPLEILIQKLCSSVESGHLFVCLIFPGQLWRKAVSCSVTSLWSLDLDTSVILTPHKQLVTKSNLALKLFHPHLFLYSCCLHYSLGLWNWSPQWSPSWCLNPSNTSFKLLPNCHKLMIGCVNSAWKMDLHYLRVKVNLPKNSTSRLLPTF